MDQFRAFTTVDDAASVAAEIISEKNPLGQVWKFAIIQLFDDYQSVLRHKGIKAASHMWKTEPRPVGDVRVDAAFAALGEHLARRDGWEEPSWVLSPEREAVPWWFVTTLTGLHPRALVESPLSFRKRGVFITSDALERA